MTAVTLTSLSKSYRDKLILNDLSITFPENSITAIMGKSGCGKSTLLRCINGLVEPDCGEIRIGKELFAETNQLQLRRQIGYAVQSVSLFPHLTVLENITKLPRLLGQDTQATIQRAEQLMAMTQLEHSYLSRYPRELSGGQQQRVALCRAMIMDPIILLLDEAFAAVDAWTKMEIQALLLQMHHDQPRTTLIVTHDMQEALTISEQIVLIDQGQIRRTIKTDYLKQKLHFDPTIFSYDQLLMV